MDKFAKSYSNFSKQKPQKRKDGFFSWGKKNQNRPISTRPPISSFTSSPRTTYARLGLSRNWRKIFWLSALACAVIAWLSLMLYLPYFRIYQVSFEGLNTIELSDIQSFVEQKYLRGGIIPDNNYFLVRASSVTKDLLTKYSLNKVEVVKIFPGKIHIILEEKNTSIIYDNGMSYSLLDKNGSVIKILSNYAPPAAIVSTGTSSGTISAAPLISSPPAISSSGTPTNTLMLADNVHKPDWRKLAKDNTARLPIFYDRRGTEVWVKKADVLSPIIIQAIIDWQTALEKETIGESRYFEIDNPSAGVIVHLDRPWLIFFQPRNPLAEQITNLKVILNSRTANPTEYIDLRFGDRVFWK